MGVLVSVLALQGGPAAGEPLGGGWRVVPGPRVAPSTGTWLLDVARVPGRATFWAVGNSFSSRGSGQGIVLWRTRGEVWRSFPGPTLKGEGVLTGVAAVSRADVWAVGSLDQSAYEQFGGLILRWNGRVWHEVAFPSPKGTSNYLAFNGITALTHRSAIAVGEYLPLTGPDVRPLAEQWNGRRWSVMPTAAVVDCAASFRSVAAIPVSSMRIAVGGCVNSVTSHRRPLIEVWNGQRWTLTASPNTAGTLNDVVAVSPNDVWAVGDTTPDEFHQGGPLIEHWNGHTWRIVATPRLADGGDLRGIARVPGTRYLWAVGMRFTTQGAGHVLTERWNGRSWRIVPAPSPDDFDALNAVAASSRTRAWGVGFTSKQSGTSTPGLIERYRAGTP